MDDSISPVDAFRHSLTAVAVVRASDSVVIGLNPAAERLLGYSSYEARLRTPGELGLWPDPLEQARAWSGIGAQGSARALDLHLRTGDGQLLALRLDCEVFQYAGAPHLLCFLRAAPARDAASAASAGTRSDAPAAVMEDPSGAAYKVLVDNSRDGMFLVQHGRVFFANQALADLLGRPLASLIGIDYIDLVHVADRDAQLQRRGEREQGSTASQRYQVRLLRGDGLVRWFEIHADAVQFQGELASTGSLRDVTDERARQQALLEAERRYRELFESAPIGLFKSHVDGRVLEINPALLRMLGFDSVEQFRASGVRMRDLYADPEQRSRLLSRLRDSRQIEDEELRVRRRDGSDLWVSCLLKVVDEPADGSEFAGAVQDISARRRAELDLQRSEAKYRTLVEHAQVGVFVARAGRFVYVNSTLCRLLGYEEAELLTRPMASFLLEEARADAQLRWRALERGEVARHDQETCYQRPDGSRVWVTESVGRVEIDGVCHLTGTLRDVTRQREIERRLRFHATHDPLTGLPNRLDFQQRLNDVIVEARSLHRHDYAVLFLDLDGFKLINDSQGHAAGDRLLVSLASRITDALAGEALVARYGGDEFTILPYGACGRARAIRLAEDLLKVFASPIDVGSERVFSGASVGIVLGMPGYRDAADVLRDADTAMYRAKAAGKQGWAVFDDAMRTAAQQRFQLEVELREALDRGELEVFYQPVVALADGRLVGCEALIRWRHPQRGLLLPADFLPVAEESGLIVRMDHWVMHEACREARHWRSHIPGASAVSVSININDRQANSPQFPADVAAALQRYALEPSALKLEITETAFRSGRLAATEQLRQLKAIGVGLVVDDFGTGYSSLDSFAAAPFDTLKIDRSFITDIDSNARHRAIVRTIIGFAADLGLSLTAEGIETEQQEHCLREFGCGYAQGYRYGHALSPEAWRERLLQAAAPG